MLAGPSMTSHRPGGPGGRSGGARCMRAGRRPLGRFGGRPGGLGRAFMARDSVRFTGVQQMRRNLPQRSHYRNWFRTGRSKEGWRIKREVAGGGCTEDTRVNGRRAADQSCGRSRSMGLWLPEAIALYAKTRSLHVVHACGRGIGEPTRDRTHPHPATPAMPVPGRAQR